MILLINWIFLTLIIAQTFAAKGEPSRVATLKCYVENEDNQTISWFRNGGIELLTSGLTTQTHDDRFRALRKPEYNEWTLEIENPGIDDSGIYECRIGSKIPLRQFMTLIVVESARSARNLIHNSKTEEVSCLGSHHHRHETIVKLDMSQGPYGSPNSGGIKTTHLTDSVWSLFGRSIEYAEFKLGFIVISIKYVFEQ